MFKTRIIYSFWGKYQVYKFVGKYNLMYVLDIPIVKLNYNCPSNEKNGSKHPCSDGNNNGNDNQTPVSNKSSEFTKVINNGKNPEMVSAIKYYTGEGYREINHALRNDNELSNEAQEHMEWLDAILDDDRAVLSKGIVYRGYNSESLLNDDDIVGSIISSPAFVSASQNKVNAKVFINTAKYPVMAEIQIPEGSKGYAIPSSMTTYNVGEDEILLPRDSEFEITDRKEQDGITWIKMKLIN